MFKKKNIYVEENNIDLNKKAFVLSPKAAMNKPTANNPVKI